MSLRPLVWPIYLPSLINQLSEQLTATSVALFALEISGSRALAGVAVGATGMGVTVANVPASLIYRLLGAQRTLATGQGISGLASLIVALGCRARSMVLFVAGLALIGVSTNGRPSTSQCHLHPVHSQPRCILLLLSLSSRPAPVLAALLPQPPCRLRCCAACLTVETRCCARLVTRRSSSPAHHECGR
jgi:hypothetical protein